jgi:carbon-monoxide dehydrogenase medium subunit
VKLPSFEYAQPRSVAEAIALLGSARGEAKLLAGGQSLLPVMAFRLAAPALLVDLKNVPGLDRIAVDATGVKLGAKVRWCDIERDPRLAASHPLLVAATRHVAHYQVRNRGTVGGSLAHADPAAELPGVAMTCDATIHVAGPSGRRAIAAAEFFRGPLSTALASDELILELELPAWRSERRWAFEELSHRRGDFALAGVALFYDGPASGRASNVHIGVIGACRQPQRLRNAEAALEGRAAHGAAIEAASLAAAAEVDPPDDLHASAGYRRALVRTLTERALRDAAGLAEDLR